MIMGLKLILLIIFVVLLLLILFYGIAIYNKLVRLTQLVGEAWSGISVQLKKRHDLVPSLVEVVKGYAHHESTTLEEVTQARASAMNANELKSQESAENSLNVALNRLFVIAEQYPDLKANDQFLQLQHQLSAIESDIEKSRRYYNGTVRNKNVAVETFPSNVIAKLFHFAKSTFFELQNESDKNVPQISI